jgi:hypothetical protein
MVFGIEIFVEAPDKLSHACFIFDPEREFKPVAVFQHQLCFNVGEERLHLFFVVVVEFKLLLRLLQVEVQPVVHGLYEHFIDVILHDCCILWRIFIVTLFDLYSNVCLDE